MKKQIITAVSVLALSASLAVAAPEGFGGHGHRHGRGGFASMKLAEKLNLSDAQKAQLKDMNKAFREQNKAFFEQARTTFKEFRAAKEANDTAKMESLQPTLDANRAQMKALRQTQEQQFVSILTPDQKAQFDTMKAEREARRQKHQQ